MSIEFMYVYIYIYIHIYMHTYIHRDVVGLVMISSTCEASVKIVDVSGQCLYRDFTS